MERMLCWPKPSLKIEKAGRSDNRIVRFAHHRERLSRAGFFPGQRSFKVTRGFGFALRNWAPAIKFAVALGCGGEAIDVARMERFQADVFALEEESVGHSKMARRGSSLVFCWGCCRHD